MCRVTSKKYPYIESVLKLVKESDTRKSSGLPKVSAAALKDAPLILTPQLDDIKKT